MEPISIQEAHDQLQACGDEVNKIKAKLSELQAENSVTALARRERELADQLLEGGDVATIVAPPMTSAQLRHAIGALEARLAEALDRQNQARGAVRRAKVDRMRQLLKAEREAYDTACKALSHQWLRVTAIANTLDAATGMADTLTGPWYRLTLPRAIVPTSHNAFEDNSNHFASTQGLLSSAHANKARTEVAELLKKEGIE